MRKNLNEWHLTFEPNNLRFYWVKEIADEDYITLEGFNTPYQAETYLRIFLPANKMQVQPIEQHRRRYER